MGSGALALSRIVMMLVPFLTIPITIDYLGSERFGVWMAATSFIAIISLAEGGLANAMVTATSQAMAKNDSVRVQDLAGSAFAVVVPVSITISLVGWWVIPMVPWVEVLGVSSPIAAREAAPIVMVIVCSTALGFIVNVGIKLRAGLKQIPQTSAWDALATVCAIPCLLLAMELKLGTPWLVASMILLPTTIKGAGVLLFFATNSRFRPRFESASPKEALSFIKSGGVFFVVAATNAVAISSDQLLIAYLESAEAVSAYAIVQRLFTLPYVLANFIFAAQWPIFAEASARGDINYIRTAFERTFFLIVVLSFFLSVSLYFFLEPLLRLWIGDSIKLSYGLAEAMALYGILLTAVGACMNLLFSLDIRREQIVLSIGMATLNFPLSIFLISRVGSSGAVLATDIAYLLCMLVPYFFIIRNKLRPKPLHIS